MAQRLRELEQRAAALGATESAAYASPAASLDRKHSALDQKHSALDQKHAALDQKHAAFPAVAEVPLKPDPNGIRLPDTLMAGIQEMIEQKYIVCQRHPNLPLRIYK